MPYRPIACCRPASPPLAYRYVPGAVAVKVRVTVPPEGASTGPASKVMPGMSRPTVRVPGSTLWTVTVTGSPMVTTSRGPGRAAVAVTQSPGVDGAPKPQIGTGSAPDTGVVVPAIAHNSMATGAAATDPADAMPAAA